METIQTDILIVGAGLAGFTAAVRASEQGAKVLLVDKSHGELGDGNVLMASGSLRAGGKSPKTGAKELYDFVMAEGIGYPDLVNSWSQTCGRAIDWLQTVGVAIEETAPGRIWFNQKSEISFGPVYKKDVGPRAIASLKQRFLSLGGSYLNGIEGVSLIVENNRVVGLIGKRDGEPVELRARATILTTGGFAANKELVKQYIGAHADRCKLRGSKQDTGDGLRMALEAGAKAVNLKYFYGHLIARKALTDDRFWPYPRLDSFVDEGLLVDQSGQPLCRRRPRRCRRRQRAFPHRRSHRRDFDLRRRIMGSIEEFAVFDVIGNPRAQSVDPRQRRRVILRRHGCRLSARNSASMPPT